ncbi:sirohydrochlorin cobaltochelatase [Verrucomicrobiota bacterium]
MDENPTIILAAHGSREREALETLRRFDVSVRQAFPEHRVIWTFADYILRKLRTGQPEAWSAETHCANELDSLHLDSAIIQPLFIAPAPLSPDFASTGFPVGDALLDPPEHIDQVASILEPQITDPDTACILCGHGSKKRPENNRPLIDLHSALQTRHANVFLATLDGPPGCDQTLVQIRRAGFKKAHFIPLMFASGMHIQSDVAGDGPDSWKNKLNLPATLAPPLGDNPRIVELFIKRIRGLLN